MPTDALFLFAHQDDEYGVYDELARNVTEGRRVTCAYLTDGAAAGPAEPRNRESLRALARLGIDERAVQFLGERHGIADGSLYRSLPQVAEAITTLLDELGDHALVYVPAWEGGHHDHDGLHAVATILLHRRGRLAQGRQFSLYNAWRRPGPLFRVLTPLPQNGSVEARRLSLHQRLRNLRLCLGYPSQRRTWLGLLPFVAARLLLDGRQTLQRLHLERVADRPHGGRLYYEKRGFLTFDRLQQAIAAWRDRS
ncbi:MAG TPA: PIG-L family deacetylase [bacterium]|nr:PIG-L family deacetylase [bacterium]